MDLAEAPHGKVTDKAATRCQRTGIAIHGNQGGAEHGEKSRRQDQRSRSVAIVAV
jgi:hypothetical protein